jgi:hypothetical protein
MAALRRATIPERERHLCLLICDEAKHVYNNQTERLLTECRKYNLGFISATQLLSQIPEAVRSAIFGATAIKVAGGDLQSSDAHRLGQEMHTTGDFLRSMEPVRGSHTEWGFSVQEFTRKKTVKVRCPYGVLEAMPKLNSTYEISRQTQRAPEPAVKKQQQNELSLRDTDLPLPQTRDGPEGASSVSPDSTPMLEHDPVVKPGKDW